MVVAAGAIAMTLAFFLVLPLMQTINKPPENDYVVREINTAEIEPPPPIPEEQEPPEPEQPEERPPELSEAPPDLSQIAISLNPGMGAGGAGAAVLPDFKKMVAAQENGSGIINFSELDQRPRVIYQPGPSITPRVRRKARSMGGGKVYIIFMVDESGRVQNPIVQQSTDKVFEKPALAAVRQWKFEPGKRKGKPVRFRMRVPIQFPKDL